MKLLHVMIVLGSLMPGGAMADQVNLAFGGDAYAAGQTATLSQPVARDAFAAGFTVTLGAPVSGSAHLAGYTVSAAADVGGDLYAAGFAVTVTGAIGGDLTAMGNSVTLGGTAPIAGNARLAGANLVVDTPIDGALLATAGALTLNAPVSGDFSFYGEALSFGPNARVDGTVAIHAPTAPAVPASVAPAERVTFEQIATPDYAGETGRTVESVLRGFWFTAWATVLWWLLLFVVGAVFIAAAPRLVGELTTLSASHPFRRLGLGVLAFAATLGLVPATALTVVGIVLLPVVLLYVAVACSLAYLAGAYFVGMRIWSAVAPVRSTAQRLVVLALSLVVAGLLILVPFLGWGVTLVLRAFGFGVTAARIVGGWCRDDAAQPGAPAPAPAMPTSAQ